MPEDKENPTPEGEASASAGASDDRTDQTDQTEAADRTDRTDRSEDTGKAEDAERAAPAGAEGDEPDTSDETEPAEPAETEDDADAEAAPAPAGPSRARRRVAAAVGVFGELMITAGVVLGLFVVYSLWWTNVIANKEASRDGDAVRDSWAQQPEEDADDTTPPREFEPEDGIGFLHVPTMTGGEILVKEGTNPNTLNGGVAGYYTDPVEAAMPWDEEGNFSIAAHRDGHGAKFHDIQDVVEGDPIVFETKNTWYIYRTYAVLPETSKYNVEVLDPVPEESGATEANRYITLTTCTPVFTSRHRYIVWGELERTEHVNADRTPPEELLEITGG